MKGVEQPPQYHPEGDVWTHTLLMIEQLPAGTPATSGVGSAASRRRQAAYFQAGFGDR